MSQADPIRHHDSTLPRNAAGWTVEVCDNPDCEESTHLFPPVGTAVAVLAPVNAREVGEDLTYDVSAGVQGEVDGYVAEWHDVHVRFESGLNLWIDPCNLTNAPKENA